MFCFFWEKKITNNKKGPLYRLELIVKQSAATCLSVSIHTCTSQAAILLANSVLHFFDMCNYMVLHGLHYITFLPIHK